MYIYTHTFIFKYTTLLLAGISAYGPIFLLGNYTYIHTYIYIYIY